MAEYQRHMTRPTQHDLMHPSRLFAAGLALLPAAAMLALTVHYPIAPAATTTLAVICCAIVFAWPNLWLVVLPALLPIIGLAPWTGWITFEELDILILAIATGGYARMMWTGHQDIQHGTHRQRRLGQALLVLPIVGLFTLSTIVAMFRGFADAGGFSFGWFQGYHEPMNSVRLAKSFAEVLLLLPLWRRAHGQDPQAAERLLSQGLMLGLTGAALATVWERAAFTDLLNFSADYRTTGLFWEMHVGGAALDGFLALSIPFALREFKVARTPMRWGLAATLLALAAYACLTTFSRGVYLAIPVGATVFLVLGARQQRLHVPRTSVVLHGPAMTSHLTPAILLLLGFTAGAQWIFQTSGYRGMAALFTSVALMLPLAQVLRTFNLSQWLMGVALGAMLVPLAGAMAWLIPKGAYIAWVLATSVTVVMLVLLRQRIPPAPLTGPIAFATFWATVAATALVAQHWGAAAGLMHALPVLLILSIVFMVGSVMRKPVWPDSLRWQGTLVGAMAMAAAVVGVFGGGAYMGNRFSTGGQDFADRLAHWRLGLDMLRTPEDWLLGKGLGRFPANYFLVGDPRQHPGDYRLNREGESSYLTLAGGLHPNGWGEIFRVTQRVSEPGARAVVTARVRAEKNVTVHFEVCEKHLLYDKQCVVKQVNIKGASGLWQEVRAELLGVGPTRGDWYAPRLLAFAMAMESRGGLANVEDVTLTSANGQQLLANGDFAEGMAHWFFSSDRYHLPWHIKNMFMNTLFDQGALGATLLALLMGGALWRTSLGTARSNALAPVLAASLSGFAVVGLFDSLLDVPRLSFVYYLLVLVALTLRRQSNA